MYLRVVQVNGRKYRPEAEGNSQSRAANNFADTHKDLSRCRSARHSTLLYGAPHFAFLGYREAAEGVLACACSTSDRLNFENWTVNVRHDQGLACFLDPTGVRQHPLACTTSDAGAMV